MKPGNLTVKPLQAQLIKDTSIIAMSPYCIIKCGQQKYVSPIHQKGGRSPQWNGEYEFKIKEEEQITYEVWDYNSSGNNDFLGDGTFKITQLCNGGYTQEWLNIQYKGKQSGKVQIDFTFVPDQKSINPIQSQQPYIPQQNYQNQQGYMQYPPQQAPQNMYPPQQQAPQNMQPQQYGQVYPQFTQPLPANFQQPLNYQPPQIIQQPAYGQIQSPQQPQIYQYQQPQFNQAQFNQQQNFPNQQYPTQQQNPNQMPYMNQYK